MEQRNIHPSECCTGRTRRRGRRRGRQESSSFTTSTSSSSSSSLLTLWCVVASMIASSTTTTITTAFTTTTSTATDYSPSFRLLQQRKKRTTTTMTISAQTLASQGLSRSYQGILSRNNDRQRFVTGKYPVIVTVEENPTRKWLNLGRTKGNNAATSLVLLNGTMIDQSLASYDRFQWLDDNDRDELYDKYTTVSLELLAEIHMVKPGYVQLLSSEGAGSSAAELRKNMTSDDDDSSSTSTNTNTNTLWKNRWRDLVEDWKEEKEHEEGQHRDRLWVTGFSLTGRKGIVKSVDVHNGHIDTVNDRSEAMTLWPNELNSVPRMIPNNSSSTHQPQPWLEEDALLVSDGFLVPGKDQGGIYIIKNPENPSSEWTICLTDKSSGGDRWFYHRAVWVDLTGDGRLSILTARAKLRKVRGSKTTSSNNNNSEEMETNRPKNGQLVWLEMPKSHHIDEATGTPLEEDGTAFDPFSARHLPWKERVLATGPDVMFNIADMDTDDDTIEVIASQFFDKKVTLHSIKRGPKPQITFSRIIDDRCGAAFGGILADLDPRVRSSSKQNVVVDSGSTVPSPKPGDTFSHLLVTSHECNYVEANGSGGDSSSIEITGAPNHHHALHNHNNKGRSETLDGGSLFAYRVPEGKDGWKTKKWMRTTVATGFKVNGQLWNVINPGAPGFVYTFHAKKDDAAAGKRPMIAVAGDCAESAYIFRPEQVDSSSDDHTTTITNPLVVVDDPQAQYKLMAEIKCGATVGSIGIGYENLCSEKQESGYAKIYIPCYEKDKILVFAMGSGEDAEDDDDGW